ncbi:MAG: hypothetical protein AAF086_03285 [Planctomycetota bacterium]
MNVADFENYSCLDQRAELIQGVVVHHPFNSIKAGQVLGLLTGLMGN